MIKLYFYRYRLADGGCYRFVARESPKKIMLLFNKFKITVRDPSYLHSRQFIPFLKKNGVDCREISDEYVIQSW